MVYCSDQWLINYNLIMENIKREIEKVVLIMTIKEWIDKKKKRLERKDKKWKAFFNLAKSRPLDGLMWIMKGWD